MEYKIGPDGRKYAADQPVSCKYCYFWAGKKAGCELEECYYLLDEAAPDEPQGLPPGGQEHRCRACPYGQVTPCIGYCLQDILREMKEKKQDRRHAGYGQ